MAQQLPYYSYPVTTSTTASNNVIGPAVTLDRYGYVIYGQEQSKVKKKILVFPETEATPLRAITLGLRSDDDGLVDEWVAGGANALHLELDPSEVEIQIIRQESK